MPTVMIVEDNARLRESVAMRLRNQKIVALEAEQLDYVLPILQDKKIGKVDLIVWGGRFPQGNSHRNIIATVKKTFAGPMIAASKSSQMRQKQMAAGCTHELDFTDRQYAQDLANLIVTLLKAPAKSFPTPPSP